MQRNDAPPILMDTELAARIRQSEIDFTTSRISSIGERQGNPMGVDIRTFGHATAFAVKDMPWPTFNVVKGITDEDAGYVEDIVRFYRERQIAFQLDIDPAASGKQLFQALVRHGMCQQAFHAVLYGPPLQETPTLPAHIRIEEIENEADFEAYAEVHCVASGMSVAHKHHFVANNIGLLHRPGWRLFLACDNGIPAAVGVMHAIGSIASCTLAATVPEHRNRGLHRALLQKRMYEAAQAGCGLVVAQAAFAGTSHRNMERSGMRTAWTRAVWAPINNQ